MNAEINISNVILETDRLILRTWELKDLDNLLGRELGYVLNKDYWNKGIMKETVSKVVDYCFNTLKLNFLMASYFNHNIASKRVLENLNFKFYKNIIIETRYNNIKEKSTLMLLKNN